MGGAVNLVLCLLGWLFHATCQCQVHLLQPWPVALALVKSCLGSTCLIADIFKSPVNFFFFWVLD